MSPTFSVHLQCFLKTNVTSVIACAPFQEACWLYHSLEHYMDVYDNGSAPKFVYKRSTKSPFNLCEISGSQADEYQKTLNFFQPLLPSSSDGQ
jgi:hypothetical protein